MGCLVPQAALLGLPGLGWQRCTVAMATLVHRQPQANTGFQRGPCSPWEPFSLLGLSDPGRKGKTEGTELAGL